MKFCSQCSEKLVIRIPDGDERERHVCDSCGTIHYQNPKVVAGCIPEFEDKILLCRRAIEPRHNFWTLPAGFMENGETLEQAAMRETWEEAEASVSIQQLYTIYSLPHISQVYMFFRAQITEGKYGCGQESLECRLFDEQQIPWDEIAFRVVEDTLKRYFADHGRHSFVQHIGTVLPANRR